MCNFTHCFGNVAGALPHAIPVGVSPWKIKSSRYLYKFISWGNVFIRTKCYFESAQRELIHERSRNNITAVCVVQPTSRTSRYYLQIDSAAPKHQRFIRDFNENAFLIKCKSRISRTLKLKSDPKLILR